MHKGPSWPYGEDTYRTDPEAKQARLEDFGNQIILAGALPDTEIPQAVLLRMLHDCTTGERISETLQDSLLEAQKSLKGFLAFLATAEQVLYPHLTREYYRQCAAIDVVNMLARRRLLAVFLGAHFPLEDMRADIAQALWPEESWYESTTSPVSLDAATTSFADSPAAFSTWVDQQREAEMMSVAELLWHEETPTIQEPPGRNTLCPITSIERLGSDFREQKEFTAVLKTSSHPDQAQDILDSITPDTALAVSLYKNNATPIGVSVCKPPDNQDSGGIVDVHLLTLQKNFRCSGVGSIILHDLIETQRVHRALEFSVPFEDRDAYSFLRKCGAHTSGFSTPEIGEHHSILRLPINAPDPYTQALDESLDSDEIEGNSPLRRINGHATQPSQEFWNRFTQDIEQRVTSSVLITDTLVRDCTTVHAHLARAVAQYGWRTLSDIHAPTALEYYEGLIEFETVDTKEEPAPVPSRLDTIAETFQIDLIYETLQNFRNPPWAFYGNYPIETISALEQSAAYTCHGAIQLFSYPNEPNELSRIEEVATPRYAVEKLRLNCWTTAWTYAALCLRAGIPPEHLIICTGLELGEPLFNQHAGVLVDNSLESETYIRPLTFSSIDGIGQIAPSMLGKDTVDALNLLRDDLWSTLCAEPRELETELPTTYFIPSACKAHDALTATAAMSAYHTGLQCKKESDHFEEAAFATRLARTLSPIDAFALYESGCMQAGYGDLAGASEYFQAAIAEHGNASLATLGLIEIALQYHQYDKARSLIKNMKQPQQLHSDCGELLHARLCELVDAVSSEPENTLAAIRKKDFLVLPTVEGGVE